MPTNSWISIARKPSPSTQVAAMPPYYIRPYAPVAPIAAKPQVKLESRRQAVSIATLCRSNRSLPLGPPAVSPESTA